MKRKYFFDDSPSENFNSLHSLTNITIDNFLIFNHIDLPIKKFTILIGPQAEGKSLLAKLIDFYHFIISSIFYQNNLEEIKNSTKIKFKKRFPQETWGSNNFSIKFTIENYKINITSKKQTSIDIEFNSILERDIKTLFELKKEIFKLEEKSVFQPTIDLLENIPYPFKLRSLFIPSLRQIFSYINTEALALDPSNTNFGDDTLVYFSKNLSAIKSSWDEISSISQNFLNSKIKKIIKCEYLRSKNKDFIINNKNLKIPIYLASSGQQEALPLLFSCNSIFSRQIIVEEPEAHLFPTTQKELITYLIKNIEGSQRLLITTHSPYILSSINNLISAYEVVNTKNKEKISAMNDIIPKDCWIPFENINCFFLENGTIEDIMDNENRLIDFDKIESCSDKIAQEFNDILKILDND